MEPESNPESTAPGAVQESTVLSRYMVADMYRMPTAPFHALDTYFVLTVTLGGEIAV